MKAIEESRMRRVLVLAAVAATLIVAGCGGSSSNSTQASAPTSNTVGVKQVAGLGRVLVDSSGMALYTPDQEAKGKIRCTGSCASEWQPLLAGSGKPSAAAGAGAVGAIKRPDGARQVTLDGMPLYTFVDDAPGQITGDGFHDKFAGTAFTWHVLLAGGDKGIGAARDSSSQYGY
jgi:predicted lipoprotein with Yx(FWY)xxD motif